MRAMVHRRQWLAWSMLVAWHAKGRAQPSPGSLPNPSPPQARAGHVLRFPEDFGAHPAFKTEWWYITGTLRPAEATTATAPPSFGFQITFFRRRIDAAQGSTSRFATHQLVFAHTALTDLQAGQMQHDQRIARTGFGLANATPGDTGLTLRGWHLRRQGPATQSRYDSHIAARDFTLALRFDQTQPLLLQGQAGYSQKGPSPTNASHYYTQPHLAVTGTLSRQHQDTRVQGQAWLDHEWGEAMLPPEVVGWDWLGMNLLDGGSLTAFRLRRADGGTVWAGGSLRRPGQPSRAFAPGELRFTPTRWWTSPATSARYPVQWQLDVAGVRHELKARLDAQELDSRHSTGNVYWEGLSELLDAQGRVIGSGYLEMTGYVTPIQL